MGKADKLLEQAREHLEPSETVAAAVMGAYEVRRMGSETVRNGVLIATDRRVVFYAKKLGGFDLESFPFGNISSFEHGKSVMGHHVTFHASGNRVVVKWLQPANEFADFLDKVKSAMNLKHQVPTSPAPPQAAPEASAPPAPGGTPVPAPASEDVLATLERLGELRDAGIVTPEEFASKKAELLARL
ncbi:PH domain-containing protein [Microbacterium sp. No. 7]|uniref:PH domain-containing protein n=1 Tax=Microbacterium sp. No. 7 TaxID=1714373 RepID=UPI00300895F9